MFESLINNVEVLIKTYPLWSGLIIFLVSMVESLAIIGFIIPGVAIMFTIGALISNGTLDMTSSLLWAASGASVGDGLSFALGWHYKKRIYDVIWLKKYRDLFNQGHQFFEKYGWFSILIGRFVGPIRAVIPLMAGILDMPLKVYIPTNIIASALWAPAYLLPGFIFGASLTALPNEFLNWWPAVIMAIAIAWLSAHLFKNR